MYVIARFQEGISLNDYEYLLDENNNVLKFESIQEAVSTINNLTGFEDTQEEWEEDGLLFLELEKEE